MDSFSEYVVPDGKKIVATFHTWRNEIVEYEIEASMIDDIVAAVEGQYTYINNKNNFGIKGGDFKHVDIWVTDKDYVLRGNLDK